MATWFPQMPQPPDPDHVAPRGTDQWRDAVTKKKKWIAYNLVRGVPLEELVDQWGEGGSSREGRLSHDYEYWQNTLEGRGYGDEPASREYAEEMWKQGNFKDLVSREAYTEWPPGSGIFFNDPANDQNAREWFNMYGDKRPSPVNAWEAPEIDYGRVNNEFGGSIKKYLAQRDIELQDEAKHKENSKKVKPVIYGNPEYDNGTAGGATKGLPTGPQPAQTPTYGAWGVKGFGSNPRPQPAQAGPNYNTPQQPMQGPNAGLNPFKNRNTQPRQQRQGGFSGQGYTVWGR